MRDAFARRRAAGVLTAWRQRARDAGDFRAVLMRIGGDVCEGTLAAAFGGWHDRVRFKAWKEGSMMR